MTNVSKPSRYPPRPTSLFISLLSMACLTIAIVGCSSPSNHQDDTAKVVIVVDRTGVAASQSWTTEVTSQAQAITTTAINDGDEHLDVVSLGSDAKAAAKVASADLTSTSRNTSDKTRAAKANLADKIGQVAGQVAGSPVTTDGSDVVAALQTAVSLCRANGTSSCKIYLLSDMEDSRILKAPNAKTAVAQIKPLIPDLSGIDIQVAGIGASGSSAAVVERVTQVWTEALAGASSADLARNI